MDRDSYNYESFRSHDYLGSWDLESGDRTVTIDRVEQGFVDGDVPGTKEAVPLIYFREFKLPLVGNSTNGKIIRSMYGTSDVRLWAGKRVTLTTVMTTTKKGEPTMGIRVHLLRPADVEIEETPQQKLARLEAEMAALRSQSAASPPAATSPAALPPAPTSAPAAPAPETTHATQ